MGSTAPRVRPTRPKGTTEAYEQKLEQLLRRAFDLGAATKEDCLAEMDAHGIERFLDWLLDRIDQRLVDLSA